MPTALSFHHLANVEVALESSSNKIHQYNLYYSEFMTLYERILLGKATLFSDMDIATSYKKAILICTLGLHFRALYLLFYL